MADPGFTVTDATGTLVTVTVDVPLLPSLVAVIVAVPAALAVARPLALTLATPELLLAHVTTRPDRVLPFASLSVAVNCTVWPTCTPADAGVTATEATETGVTLTDDVPLCPSLVAVMVPDPVATAVTTPLPLTRAIVVSLLDHVTARPDKTLPLASLRVAVSCAVCPTDTVADDGVTVTEATGAVVTVTAAVPLFPSLVAVIVAEPAATPLTRPVLLTVAAAVLLLDQVTVLPVSTFPAESNVVAVSWRVCPGCTLADAGLTLTAETGGRVTATVAVSDTLPG